MHGRVYRSYNARPRMTLKDWMIAAGMALPITLVIAAAVLVRLAG